MTEALSLERIRQAHVTLMHAFLVSTPKGAEQLGVTDGPFPGAVGEDDAAIVFSNARRNLTALVQYLYGDEAFEHMLMDDG